MNWQYLKNAFRKIYNKGFFSFINIIGLSIGIFSFFVLILYYSFENSYDKFFPKSENIYRVSLELNQNGKKIFNKATSSYAIGPLVKKEIPEVKEYARAGYEECLVYLNTDKQQRQDLFWVDSTFLRVIPVEMIIGDRSNALSKPYTAVLSDKLAHFYFGNENPINKTIYINEHLSFTITGVFKSLPENSHFNFKLLLSLSTGNVLWPGWGTNNVGWDGHSWLYTYVSLNENVNQKLVGKKIDQVAKNHLPERFLEQNYEYKFNLQPIQDIHLNSHLESEFKLNGSKI